MTTRIRVWAPVALFIYKRPEHVRRMISSLQKCVGYAESPVVVFADGPKTEAEVPAARATRAVARQLLGNKAVFVEQERNRGLANSIITGTTELCDRYGSIIVVEDDLILAPSFLRFLNEGLEHFANEPRVMQISGHIFDVPSVTHQREALLLPLTTSWGWATWKRAWDLFDPSATGWHERLTDAAEAQRFNLGGRYDYHRMLKRQMNGEIDSWAIRWYYSVFEHDGLVLFPPRTLVSNGGFDGSGTHGRLARNAEEVLPETVASFILPSEVAESRQKEHIFEAIGALRPPSARRRLFNLMKVAFRRGGFA